MLESRLVGHRTMLTYFVVCFLPLTSSHAAGEQQAGSESFAVRCYKAMDGISVPTRGIALTSSLPQTQSARPVDLGAAMRGGGSGGSSKPADDTKGVTTASLALHGNAQGVYLQLAGPNKTGNYFFPIEKTTLLSCGSDESADVGLHQNCILAKMSRSGGRVRKVAVQVQYSCKKGIGTVRSTNVVTTAAAIRALDGETGGKCSSTPIQGERVRKIEFESSIKRFVEDGLNDVQANEICDLAFRRDSDGNYTVNDETVSKYGLFLEECRRFKPAISKPQCKQYTDWKKKNDSIDSSRSESEQKKGAGQKKPE